DLDVRAVRDARAAVDVRQADQGVGAHESRPAAALGGQAIGLGGLFVLQPHLALEGPLDRGHADLERGLVFIGADSSSFSQPGIAFWSTAGSRNASQTFCRGALTSYEPSSFIGSSPH